MRSFSGPTQVLLGYILSLLPPGESSLHLIFIAHPQLAKYYVDACPRGNRTQEWYDLDIKLGPCRLPILRSSSECESLSLLFGSLTSLCLQMEYWFKI